MRTAATVLTIFTAQAACLASPNPEPLEIQSRDLQGFLGVHHVGVCERHPTLLIEPRPINDTQRTFGRSDMANFKLYAQGIAQLYSTRCPDVERVRLAITPLPNNYGCREHGDCFLEAVRSDGVWTLLDDQIVLSVPTSPVRNSDDLTELLAAGRFDLLDAYSGTANGAFNYYIVAYYVAFSKNCAQHIMQPVRRVLSPDQEVRNGGGSLLRVERGANLVVNVEQDQVDVFDSRYSPAMYWALGATLSSIRNPSAAANSLQDFDDRVERFVSNACTDERLLTVQHNMLAFARGQSPITGRFTTSKQRGAPPRGGGPSAPDFTASYLNERPAKVAALHKDRADRRAAARIELIARPIDFTSIDSADELDQAFKAIVAEVGAAWGPELLHPVRAPNGSYSAEYLEMQQQSVQIHARIFQAYQQRRLEIQQRASRRNRLWPLR